MKRQIRGLKRRAIQLDLNLYRVEVPIRGVSDSHLSVVDLWPEGIEQTVVFVHGYAGVVETWEYQINHFRQFARVIAPDLRGHGQSDAPFTTYNMDELVQDLETIADELQLPEKFSLVGHPLRFFLRRRLIRVSILQPHQARKRWIPQTFALLQFITVKTFHIMFCRGLDHLVIWVKCLQ